MLARIASSVLGAWLVVSAVLWPHTPTHGFNNFFIGCLLMLNGFSGIWMRSLRFVDAGLALWLLLFQVVSDHDRFWTVFHDSALALVVLILAFVRGADADLAHDHWIADFDHNPRLTVGPWRRRLLGL